jgi:endonuclease/exonuclease/phosphatase family metal-dependent hydrolase
VEKKEDHLRVLDWNLRYFVPFNNTNFKPDEELNLNAILNEIREFQPDILCFQEFFENAEEKRKGNVKRIVDELGYPFHYFSKDKIFWKTIMAGTAIFSRYPIIHAELVKYPDNISRDGENTIFTDILYKGDTIRVFSIHLQSFGFKSRDYKSLSQIENQNGESLEASKNLLRKMRYTFAFHSHQSEFTMDLISKSPYPVIVCGDLNDVPNSYAYTKIRGDRKDAFLEKGAGIGKTFTSATSRLLGELPTLRIDYIFTDPGMEIGQFTQIDKRLSDHHGIIADVKLKEKE